MEEPRREIEFYSIEELAKEREAEYEHIRRMGDDFSGALVRIYSSPTHFVYELLQNADDAGAEDVCFDLRDDMVVFKHNGPKDFSMSDIVSITGAGNSTKKDSSSTVGKFGIGFKSVFAITNTPEIYNRSYNFKIENLAIPRVINPISLGSYTTIIKLPFKDADSSDVIRKIKREFKDMNSLTIMFLRNIRHLTLKYGDNDTEIEIVKNYVADHAIVSDVHSDEKYYLYADTSSGVSIVYAMSDNKIVSVDNANLYSYLPLKLKSGLSFYLDAPFELSRTREAIVEGAEWNQALMEKIAEAYKASILSIKECGLISADFLDAVLPLDSESCDDEIYDCLYDATIEMMEDEEILPIVGGGYASAGGGVVYRYAEMADLAKVNLPWFDIECSRHSLREFIRDELGVREVEVDDFIEAVYGTLKNRTNEWLVKFYSLASRLDRPGYCHERSRIQSLPIVKNRLGDFVAPYRGKEEVVFRPPAKGLDESAIISNLFTSKTLSKEERERLNRFLAYMEVSERTPSAHIQNSVIVPWDDLGNDEREDAFRLVCRIYNRCGESDRNGVENLIGDSSIFPGVAAGERKWCKCSELMIGTDKQKGLLENGLFIDDDFWGDEDSDDSCAALCRELGIIEGLPVKTYEESNANYAEPIDLAEVQELGLPHVPQSRWWFSEENYIDNIEELESAIDSCEKVKSFISLILDTPKELYVNQASRTPYGCRVAYKTVETPASYLTYFRHKPWIIMPDGARRTASSFTKSEFSKAFGIDSREEILNLLDLLPDPVDSLPCEMREMCEFMGSMSEAERQKAIELVKAHFGVKLRDGDEDADEEVNGSIIDEIEIEEVFPALSDDGQVDAEDFDDIATTMTDSEIIGVDSGGLLEHEAQIVATANVEAVVKNEPHGTPEYRKAMGDAGEKKILAILKEKFPDYEVKWFGENNKGYDYAITKDGNNEFFVDAKTISGSVNRVMVTPSEWNMAKVYGDRYMFYVLNARTGRYFVIKNPYQLYLDNRINVEVNAITFKR